MKTKLIITLALLIVISGCASNRPSVGPGSGYGAGYEPVVDHYGIDKMVYRSDLYECQALASQFKQNSSSSNSESVNNAVIGAVVGAAVGAAIGNKKTAKQLAGVGAVGSYVNGRSSSSGDAKDVVIRCLKGRGYKVLK